MVLVQYHMYFCSTVYRNVYCSVYRKIKDDVREERKIVEKILRKLLTIGFVLLVNCSIISSIPALQDAHTANIESYGTIKYSPWSGPCITDLAWEPYGNSTFEEQFDLLPNGSAVRIYLNYWAWRRNPIDNSLGLPYRQFLEVVAAWCIKRSIEVVWSFHAFSRWGGNWDFDAKRTFLLTEQINMPNINNDSEDWTGNQEPNFILYWSDWFNWLEEVASSEKLRAATVAFDIFNEPPWAEDWENLGSFQQALEDKYIEFLRHAIDSVRGVVPDLKVVVEGCPFWRPVLFLEKPLNRSNVIYAMHWYGHNLDPYANDWPETLVARAYAEGRYTEGKARMLEIFNNGYMGCGALFKLQDVGLPVIFSEVGTDSYKQETYWTKWMQDFYDICKERGVGFLQHGFFFTPRPIPDPEHYWWYCYGMLNNDLRSLNEVGLLLRDNLQP